MLTRNALKAAATGEVLILVDSMTQVQNCTRAAESLGWNVVCNEQDDTFELTMSK
jgi:hypothetical protein